MSLDVDAIRRDLHLTTYHITVPTLTLCAEVERLRHEVADLQMQRDEHMLDNQHAHAEGKAEGKAEERAAVLALLDRELEVAEAHDLLMGTLRVRQLRDIIERGEHRKEES